MSRLQRPEPGQGRFQFDAPISVDSRFGMTEDSRLNPQPTTKSGSDDGGTVHSAVIMISDAPGVYEDTAAQLYSVRFERTYMYTCSRRYRTGYAGGHFASFLDLLGGQKSCLLPVVMCVSASLGDSFVAWLGDTTGPGRVGRVATESHHRGLPLTTYNLGVRRDTSLRICTRLAREVAPRRAHAEDPRIVISFGVNDTAIKSGTTRVTREQSLTAPRSISTAIGRTELIPTAPIPPSPGYLSPLTGGAANAESPWLY